MTIVNGIELMLRTGCSVWVKPEPTLNVNLTRTRPVPETQQPESTMGLIIQTTSDYLEISRSG